MPLEGEVTEAEWREKERGGPLWRYAGGGSYAAGGPAPPPRRLLTPPRAPAFFAGRVLAAASSRSTTFSRFASTAKSSAVFPPSVAALTSAPAFRRSPTISRIHVRRRDKPTQRLLTGRRAPTLDSHCPRPDIVPLPPPFDGADASGADEVPRDEPRDDEGRGGPPAPRPPPA